MKPPLRVGVRYTAAARGRRRGRARARRSASPRSTPARPAAARRARPRSREAQARGRALVVSSPDGKLVAPEGPEDGAAVAGARSGCSRHDSALESPARRTVRRRTVAAVAGARGPSARLDIARSDRVCTRCRSSTTACASAPSWPAFPLDRLRARQRRSRSSARSPLAFLLLARSRCSTHWILGKALLPVSRMTEDAAAWSDHDLDQRFDRGEPYDELTQLAATLDAPARTPRPRASATSSASPPSSRTSCAHRSRGSAAETELALRRQRSSDDYRASLEAVASQRRTDDPNRRRARLGGPPGGRAARATSDARDAVRNATTPPRTRPNPAGIDFASPLPSEPITVAIERRTRRTDRSSRCSTTPFATGSAPSRSDSSQRNRCATIEVVDDGTGVSADEATASSSPAREAPPLRPHPEE